MTELKALMAEITREGGSSALERDAAIGLRRVEAAARESAKVLPGGSAFQQLLIRMLQPQGGSDATSHKEGPSAPASSLIIP